MRPVRTELFHADGRTDMMKLIVAFRNVATTSKKSHEFNYYEVSYINRSKNVYASA